MHYDRIERSVCTIDSASFFLRCCRQGQFIQYAGHCMRPTWTISLINVAPLTRHIQSSGPLINNYSITELNPNEQNTNSFDDVHSLGKGTAFYEKRYTPVTIVAMLYLCIFFFRCYVLREISSRTNDVMFIS